MKLVSPVFQHEGKIPSKYTCDGDNVNPPLQIEEIPKGTVSLVLIMDDPDVPEYIREDGMWVHWVVFNIIPTLKEIPEDTQPEGVAGSGTRKTLIYGGPCPPDREHRYFFKLYALDIKLGLSEGARKKQVEDAMQGHIIEESVLMGRYERVQSGSL